MSSYRNNCNLLLSLAKAVKVLAENLVAAAQKSCRVPEPALVLDQGNTSTAEASGLSSVEAV